MRVFVNGEPLDLLPGMQVRHALIQLGLLRDGGEPLPRVRDQWGNLLGLNGALEEGALLFLDPLEQEGSP